MTKMLNNYRSLIYSWGFNIFSVRHYFHWINNIVCVHFIGAHKSYSSSWRREWKAKLFITTRKEITNKHMGTWSSDTTEKKACVVARHRRLRTHTNNYNIYIYKKTHILTLTMAWKMNVSCNVSMFRVLSVSVSVCFSFSCVCTKPKKNAALLTTKGLQTKYYRGPFRQTVLTRYEKLKWKI